MLGLRRREGVSRDEFRKLTGSDLETVAGTAIGRHLVSGLLERTAEGIRLTREGRFLADTVIVDFV